MVADLDGTSGALLIITASDFIDMSEGPQVIFI